MQESAQRGDSPLPVDPSSLKRSFSYDEEGVEVLSPEKRPRLEDKSGESAKGALPEDITKIADSPMPVKDACQEECMNSKAERTSSGPLKLEDLKVEQNECTEKEQELQGKLSQKSKDKDSQSNTVGDRAGQSEPKDSKLEQDDPELQIVFSDEEDEGGANGSHVTSGRMLSSQMNRQIDRVQVFLKLERLRRPKK